MKQKLSIKLIISLMFLILISALASCHLGEKPGARVTSPAALEQAVHQNAENIAMVTNPAHKPAADKKVEDRAEVTTPATHEQAAHKKAKDTVNLWITTDFGNQVLLTQKVKPVPGENVLQLMQRIVEVKTAYGGGYIQGLNGVSSSRVPGSETKAWFVYPNGILSASGAGDILVEPGQTIWWDFHAWENTPFVPAAIGAFPQPLTNSNEENTTRVRIIHTAGNGTKKEAEKLKDFLERDGSRVTISLLEENSPLFERSCPTILLACGPELEAFPKVKTLWSNPERTGIFCRFEDGMLLALDEKEKVRKQCGPGSACIVATGTGMGDKSPLWIMAGTDEDGMKKAVRLLLEDKEQLRFCFGLVISQEGITRLPVPPVR